MRSGLRTLFDVDMLAAPGHRSFRAGERDPGVHESQLQQDRKSTEFDQISKWPSGHMLHKAAGLPELFASLDPGSSDDEPGTGGAGPRRVTEKGTAVGVRPRGHPVRGDAKELGDLFDELDEDGDGLVTFAQYADAVRLRRNRVHLGNPSVRCLHAAASCRG
jgi:hypothetical protein